MIKVAARRGGIVNQVYVNEGDRVVAGQILARQEDDETRLAAQSAAAAVTEARAQLGMTRVELTTARREYDRLSKLAATNNVAAQRLDQARDQIAQAEARIASQDAAIQTAQSRLAEARYNQELTIIRAPMDGRITRRYAQPGAGASTLNVTAMFDLEPDTARIVRAEIVEADIPNVAGGPGGRADAGRRPDQDHRGSRVAPRRRLRRPPASVRRPFRPHRRTGRRGRGLCRQHPPS